jgi:hypothetical protein
MSEKWDRIILTFGPEVLKLLARLVKRIRGK